MTIFKHGHSIALYAGSDLKTGHEKIIVLIGVFICAYAQAQYPPKVK